MFIGRKTTVVTLVLALAGCAFVGVLAVRAEPGDLVQYEKAELVGYLKISGLHESSGLAASRRDSNLLWSHNDSGDKPRLFAFAADGTELGECTITGAIARDWEDMASFERNGKPFLLIGDTGDNSRRRDAYTLYRVPELPVSAGKMTVDQVVKFQFEGGPNDCEAIAYDSSLDQVVLISKGWEGKSNIFTLDWPAKGSQEKCVAKRVGELNVAAITALDISPDGRRAIVLTYGPAYQFTRDADESWQDAFGGKGSLVILPFRRQGEAICYGSDGQTLFSTSERRPTPLFRVLRSASESQPENSQAKNRPAIKSPAKPTSPIL